MSSQKHRPADAARRGPGRRDALFAGLKQDPARGLPAEHKLPSMTRQPHGDGRFSAYTPRSRVAKGNRQPSVAHLPAGTFGRRHHCRARREGEPRELLEGYALLAQTK